MAAKMTCRTTMMYRHAFRHGFGCRSWHTRMAIAMLGKLKAPIENVSKRHRLLVLPSYVPILKAILLSANEPTKSTKTTYGSRGSGIWQS